MAENRDGLAAGAYEIEVENRPTTVAVKIIDMLGEDLADVLDPQPIGQQVLDDRAVEATHYKDEKTGRLFWPNTMTAAGPGPARLFQGKSVEPQTADGCVERARLSGGLTRRTELLGIAVEGIDDLVSVTSSVSA